MTTFFTSDQHFGHHKVIGYSKRPFENADEMNREMVGRWNEVVGPKDTVYFGGDLALCHPDQARDLVKQLNGHLHWVTGNHDKKQLIKKLGDLFESIQVRKEVKISDPDAPKGRRLIIVDHYSMNTWRNKHWGSWHLFGHSHGMARDNPYSRSFDMGVDCHDYTPISYAQVKAIMAEKLWTPPFENRGSKGAESA